MNEGTNDRKNEIKNEKKGRTREKEGKSQRKTNKERKNDEAVHLLTISWKQKCTRTQEIKTFSTL